MPSTINVCSQVVKMGSTTYIHLLAENQSLDDTDNVPGMDAIITTHYCEVLTIAVCQHYHTIGLKSII